MLLVLPTFVWRMSHAARRKFCSGCDAPVLRQLESSSDGRGQDVQMIDIKLHVHEALASQALAG